MNGSVNPAKVGRDAEPAMQLGAGSEFRVPAGNHPRSHTGHRTCDAAAGGQT